MSGIQETFAGRIEFVLLDVDNSAHDAKRAELGLTAQAQYVLVNSAGEIVGRWFGVLNETNVTSELETLLQS
ncbi:MAG: hypothetical protein OXG85_00490 [Chloroflexi bacterium]|nr:hypothetical protein [Chloroflexota bacterium]